jgi:hypothetical protein
MMNPAVREWYESSATNRCPSLFTMMPVSRIDGGYGGAVMKI